MIGYYIQYFKFIIILKIINLSKLCMMNLMKYYVFIKNDYYELYNNYF